MFQANSFLHAGGADVFYFLKEVSGCLHGHLQGFAVIFPWRQGRCCTLKHVWEPHFEEDALLAACSESAAASSATLSAEEKGQTLLVRRLDHLQGQPQPPLNPVVCSDILTLPGNCNVRDRKIILNVLEKSLSASYLWFIHVFWYTEDSILVNKAIVVNAIRETAPPLADVST